MGNYYVQRTKHMLIFIIIIAIWILWCFFGPVYKCKNVDKKSEWYVNDMYMSNQYYYENLLNLEEKIVYKQLFENIKNINESFTIKTTSKTLNKAWDALICDHPEMINITTFSYSGYEGYWIIKPFYLTTSKFSLRNKERKIRRKISKVYSKTRGKSAYEKEKYIYEYLGKHSTYGHAYNHSDQSAYTAFVLTSNTVCAGYGKAAQILLSNCGINSIININSNHIWNTVELDGEYYFFDSTASANNANKEASLDNVSYVGLNQNRKTSSYEILYESVLPDVSGEKYNYYDYSGLCFTYSDEILDDIKQIINKSKFNMIELKFTNLEEAIRGLNSNSYYLGIRGIYKYDGNCNILAIRKQK